MAVDHHEYQSARLIEVAPRLRRDRRQIVSITRNVHVPVLLFVDGDGREGCWSSAEEARDTLALSRCSPALEPLESGQTTLLLWSLRYPRNEPYARLALRSTHAKDSATVRRHRRHSDARQRNTLEGMNNPRLLSVLFLVIFYARFIFC